jgi:hypothetical protein
VGELPAKNQLSGAVLTAGYIYAKNTPSLLKEALIYITAGNVRDI